MVSTDQPQRKRARRLYKLAASNSDDAYENEQEAEAVGSDSEYAVGDEDILPMPKQAMVPIEQQIDAEVDYDMLDSSSLELKKDHESRPVWVSADG
mmetsp:Transcript_5140/g.7120  ORF Transcript_5140/g.7120 Transcript_5140/m.7120 type:complete len:96 (+) Transcript_5140:438-725(+)